MPSRASRDLQSRIADADEFYQRITPQSLSEDERRVHRQALAGMLWSKQYYYFDLEKWLLEHQSHPLLESGRQGVRNTEWFHMLNADVISMPDKWEYPWYAAWDLAFHTICPVAGGFRFRQGAAAADAAQSLCPPQRADSRLRVELQRRESPGARLGHALYLYKYERTLGRADLRFLERSFQGLMLNFNWWVNRKDPRGRNVFAGGFLGLDNIGVFDRSAPLPTGGSLEQADGTAWMAFYCQCMLEMALILTEYDPMYEEVAFKFVQHFMWISYAMDRRGEHQDEMWDEQDGFFYDLLRLPDGQAMRLKVRSLVGLLPLCASTVFEADAVTRYPKLMEMVALFGSVIPSWCPMWPRPTRACRLQRTASVVDPQQEEAGASARLPARRERVSGAARHPFAVAPSPGSSVHVLGGARGVQGAVPAGGIEYRHVRRELELAGSGVDAGQHADHPGAVEPVRLLRRRIQGGVSYRFRPVSDAVRSGAGNLAPPGGHLPA
jgi:hypothetical protein